MAAASENTMNNQQPVKNNYILIDYENVQVQSLALLNGDQFHVRIFLGPNNTKLPVELAVAMQRLGSRGEYIVLETPGSNTLDFHIAYYLGTLSAADPTGYFHIISKDTGFDPLIQHLRRRKILAARSAAIEELPCFKTPDSAAEPAQKQKMSTEELLKLVLDELFKYKDNKPCKVATLRKVIQVRCKSASAAEIDAVYNSLVKRGYIKIKDEQVIYTLPSACA